MPNATPEIMTPEETADLLRVSLSWLYEKSRRRQRHPLPVHRIGRYLRYRRSEVLVWFDQQCQPATYKRKKEHV
jgi:predicted DNA-binding transcriptional regulator AlpA